MEVWAIVPVGVVGLGIALIIFDRFEGRRWARVLGWTLTFSVCLLGGAATIGRWTTFPGSISLIFLSLGLAALMNSKTNTRVMSQPFAYLIPVIGFVFYSAISELYSFPDGRNHAFLEPMDWLNFGPVLLFTLSIMAAHPLRWPVNILTASYTSMRLSRYYLLFSALVPTVVGFAILAAYKSSWIEVRGGLVILTFTTVAVSWVCVLNASTRAYRLNLARDLAVRRLEQSWKAREAYFRSLVDESPIILYTSDRDGNRTFISKKWQEFTGRPPIQDLGAGWVESLHPDDQDRVRSASHQAHVGNLVEPYTKEYRLRRWDGQYRWVISIGIPRFDDRRRFLGYTGTVIDIHDHKLQEDSLLKGKRAAEISNQTKSQFLANMSHEIRTPLNAILGFADLCSDRSCTNDERLDFLKRIRCNGDHLLRLIDDILDLAKMESGSPTVQKSEFSLEKVVDETIASLRALASQKGLSLELTCSIELPRNVYSDPHRIKQIVTNLVGNAIKFTDSGGVKIKAELNGEGQVQLDIVDSGIGLSPDQQVNIFKPFSQADSSVTRKYGGTGLGLHLSRKLAHSLGGEVILKESVVGSGSTFRFTFPAESAPKQKSKVLVNPVPTASQRKLYGKKILVAEDSPDSRELIQLYFRPTGAQVLTAENGFEAVAAAWKELPELILMDVQMPGMDGLEATRRLRADGYTRPIVALTAHALQDEVDRSFEAGCNYHLTKPVTKDVLLGLVSELVQHAPPEHHI